MSKLIDRIRVASQCAPQPLGFGKAAQAPQKPGMLLIASFALADAERLADSFAGADAGLCRISAGTEMKSLKAKPPAGPEIPWGVWLSAAAREEGEAIANAGFDFVVFPLTASLGIFREDSETGYILQVDTSISDSLARTIEDLPIDAVLVASEPAPPFVDWRHLLQAHRLAAAADKPLLFTLAQNATSDDLQMFWEAGVDGVVADAGAGAIPKLRQEIDKLREPPPRKRAKPGALLPRIATETVSPAEEEGDEDDGEE